MTKGETIMLHNPTDMPDLSTVASIEEPMVRTTILVPDTYLGAVLKLCTERRGVQQELTYVGSRAMVVYQIPLNEIVFDFYDRLKSITSGYASFDYELTGYEQSDLVKVQILINEEPVDALAFLCHRSEAESRGRQICERLKDLIPRHLFKIPIQAAMGALWRGRRFRPCARMLRRNVMAAMLPVNASCWTSKRKASKECASLARWRCRSRRLLKRCESAMTNILPS